jgi:hypothetical protein
MLRVNIFNVKTVQEELGVTVCCCVLLCVTVCCCVLLCVTVCYCVLLCVTVCYCVSEGILVIKSNNTAACTAGI